MNLDPELGGKLMDKGRLGSELRRLVDETSGGSQPVDAGITLRFTEATHLVQDLLTILIGGVRLEIIQFLLERCIVLANLAFDTALPLKRFTRSDITKEIQEVGGCELTDSRHLKGFVSQPLLD